ncbi:hypothetical protein GCM10029963_76690 [Micromonospora andamanensis]
MSVDETVRPCNLCPIRHQEDSAAVLGSVRTEWHLSARELQVAALVVAGRTNEQIAHELMVGVSTVKKHVTRILAKSDSRSRTELTVKWWAGGTTPWFRPPGFVSRSDQL